MPVEVQAPDGSVVSFPDNTPAETIHGVMMQTFAPQSLSQRFDTDFGANFGRRGAGSDIAQSLARGDNPYVDPSTGRALPGTVAANAGGAALATLPITGPYLPAAARIAGTAGGLGALGYEALKGEGGAELLKELPKDALLALVLRLFGHK